MQAAVGLNPVVIIIAILVGGNLLGVWGALLSIPFLTILTIIFRALRRLSPTLKLRTLRYYYQPFIDKSFARS